MRGNHKPMCAVAPMPAQRVKSKAKDSGRQASRGKAKVSLTMIVRNEEKNLPRCLESVWGFFDEIIVVDTGSTDRTKEIAAGFGARVVDFVWIEDFAAARNVALDYATGDYAFWLDADDVIEPPQTDKLKNLLSTLRVDKKKAYVLRCFSDTVDGGVLAVDQPRLLPLLADRYVFLIYRQLKSGVEAGDIFCRDSVRFRSIKDDLIDEALWRDHKDRLIAEAGLAILEQPIEKHLAELKGQLETRLAEVNRRIASGENTHFKLKGGGGWTLEYLLNYIDSPSLRQSVQKAMNRGENYHQLRRAISHAGGGKLRFKTEYEQELWAECSRLIANCIIFYNASILSRLLEHQEKTGDTHGAEATKTISPIAWQHINLQGRYEFLNQPDPLNVDAIIRALVDAPGAREVA